MLKEKLFEINLSITKLGAETSKLLQHMDQISYFVFKFNLLPVKPYLHVCTWDVQYSAFKLFT